MSAGSRAGVEDPLRRYGVDPDRVMVVDTQDGHVVGTVPGTEGVHGVVLDRKSGKAYTSNGRGNNVTKFDIATLRVEGTYPVSGQGPDSIVFDESSSEIWTFNGKSHDASVLATDGHVVATVALAGKPEFAVSDAHGTIFVNDEDHATMIAIDVAAHRVRATWKLDDCEEPSGLAFDGAHERLFSVCQNGHMSITDARSGRHVGTVPIGKGPDGAAFDAALGNAYSSNGTDGTVTVVHERDPDHFDVAATLDTQKSARTMALDASDHRIFLAAARFEETGTPPQPGHRPPMAPDSFAILVVAPPVAHAGQTGR